MHVDGGGVELRMIEGQGTAEGPTQGVTGVVMARFEDNDSSVEFNNLFMLEQQ